METLCFVTDSSIACVGGTVTLSVSGASIQTGGVNTSTLTASGLCTADRLKILDATGAAGFSVEAPSIKATDGLFTTLQTGVVGCTTATTTGTATVGRLRVLDPSPVAGVAAVVTTTLAASGPASAYSLTTSVPPTDASTYGVDTQRLRATAAVVTSLDAGLLGSISTGGTVSAGVVSVKDWSVVQTADAGLRLSSGASKTEVSNAVRPPDAAGKAYCLASGSGVVVGCLVSASGTYSSLTTTVAATAISAEAAVPVVRLTQTATAKRYVGVVAAVESVAPERAVTVGTLTFRSTASDTRVVVNVSGFGAVLVNGQGGNIDIGDLLCVSTTAGVATRQADDIVRSSTVGKATAALVIGALAPAELIGCKYF